jgi:hypothetical protein
LRFAERDLAVDLLDVADRERRQLLDLLQASSALSAFFPRLFSADEYLRFWRCACRPSDRFVSFFGKLAMKSLRGMPRPHAQRHHHALWPRI